LFIVYSLLFLVTAVIVFGALQRRGAQGGATNASGALERPSILSTAGLAIGGFAVIYLGLAGMRTGFPLLMGADRYLFRASSASIVTLNLLILKYLLAAVLGTGAAFAKSRGWRDLHHATFAALILVSFLYGDKFFVILCAASFYAMPFLLRDPQRMTHTLVRIAPFAALTIVGVLAVTLFIYSNSGAMSLEATLVKIAGRVAGQGQLWFLTVEESPAWFVLDLTIVRENLLAIFASPAATYVFDHRLAAFYFIEKYSSGAMYLSWLHNGGVITPTIVLEAYGLVAFGYLGLATLMGVMGTVVGVLAHWLCRAMLSGNPVRVLLPAYVMTQTIVFMTQATLYSVIGVGALKAYAAFLLLQVATSAWSGRPPGPRPAPMLNSGRSI
jgi:hypothetical protein